MPGCGRGALGAPATVPASSPRRSRTGGRLFYALALGVGIWALVLFIADLPSNAPVYAAVPTQPAPVSQCVATDGLGNSEIRKDHVWVDADPSGAVALWLPTGWRPCTSVLTRLDAGRARALAAALRSAQPPTDADAVSNGPAHPYPSVTVFFIYPRKAKAEVIRLSIGPSVLVTAPGRDFRVISPSDRAALPPFPAAWSNGAG